MPAANLKQQLFKRMLIAQAIIEKLTLVTMTMDRLFIVYDVNLLKA